MTMEATADARQRFRRRPREIEAVRVTNENLHEAMAWCGGRLHRSRLTGTPDGVRATDTFLILTGHWLCLDQDGKFFDMPDHKFRDEYEEAQ